MARLPASAERDWPDFMKTFVKQYGEEIVWSVGLEHLRFPPTWITTPQQFQMLRAAILKGQ